MNRRSALQLAAVLTGAFLLPLQAFAGKSEIFTGLVEGVGAGGFDVVSYQAGTPVEGKPEFTTKWKGAEWRFASAENRDAFAAAPETYAPQFGGYCAFAVSKGATAKGDPKVWTVVDKKLYFNFNEAVQTNWKEDIPGNISKAESNWPKVLN
ncbi:MAG: YHS domain-containing (seleno)protein [Rhizobiaceae bacterium]